MSADQPFLDTGDGFTRIGNGDLGGKANGLVFFQDMLVAEYDPGQFPQIEVGVPTFAVICTDFFDAFMQANDLYELAMSDSSDEEMARAFQRASLPRELVRNLEGLIEQADFPLAVRSSSLLEDTIFRPFAGVYETKMIPNNQQDPGQRLRKLVESIQLVYASTYFTAAKRYLRAAGKARQSEKMAVIVQEVIGTPQGDNRFYPCLSGVGRSYNCYPIQGARREDGVVNLALGLGKTIVDGGICWPYSPARPKAPPPYGSVGELLKNSQLDFWCLSLGTPAEDNPIAETEHLVRADLAAAEADGTLAHVASTYDPRRDRLVPGIGVKGPRVVNFVPLLVLQTFPLNDVVRCLLSICERAAGAEVEIEFALSIPHATSDRARLGFLQVRPMVVCHERVEISDEELSQSDLLLASKHVMGNGNVDGIRDVVFVKPESFEARFTPAIAAELERMNSPLLAQERPYLLVGFGRWGSADPWLGIPVDWGQICGSKVIVETTLPEMNVEASQGSHFFHNISSFQVSYMCVHHDRPPGIDWDWLNSRRAVAETRFLRHVRLDDPLRIKVDGRSGRGAIWYGTP